MYTDRVITLLFNLALAAGASMPSESAKPAPVRRMLLITLDTTRADAIGAWGGRPSTPNLDRLARAGTRWQNALTVCPLTLPAHASLLTGLDPPEHGLRVNGQGGLAAELPTLASVLDSRGWATAAFIGSRVLDRRFGLARGFAHYDDHMAAEHIGQYGYPERDAAAVTDSALGWMRELGAGSRAFAWVHYYDPHAPCDAPNSLPGADQRTRYLDEVAWVDQQIGRLLDGLPGGAGAWLIAVVGDHGEALGEHGEETHGLFLYRGVLEVPLLLCGPNVAADRVITEPVSTTRLAATVLDLIAITDSSIPGPTLLASAVEVEPEPPPIYSESQFPAAAYGWAPLAALTHRQWRFIRAPRPELYDLRRDPDEIHNVIGDEPEVVSDLKELLAALAVRTAEHPVTAVTDAEINASLRALGYLEGGAEAKNDGIDPKDGLALLEAMDEARLELRKGRPTEALHMLAPVVEKNPSNPVAWARLAEARDRAGDLEGAAAARRRAAALRPSSEFSQLALGDAEMKVGNLESAQVAWRRALELDPRYAAAWQRLTLLAGQTDGVEAERSVLRQAAAADTDSMVLLLRLASLEEAEVADGLYARATELLPDNPAPWLEWGRSLEQRHATEKAAERYREAARHAPADPRPALALGKLLLTADEPDRARPHLQRAAVLGRGSPEGTEAAALLKVFEEKNERLVP